MAYNQLGIFMFKAGPINIFHELSAPLFRLCLLSLLISCGGGGGGGVQGTPDSALAPQLGPVGVATSSATGDLMGAKGDAEALPAGNLITKTACLSLVSPGTPAAMSPTAETTKTPVPKDGTLKFSFKGTFEPELGNPPSPLEITCSNGEGTKGAPIRMVWSSEDFTEPKYRDILAEDLMDGVNVTLGGFTPKIGDRLSFYFYENAFFVTEIIDEATRKTSIRNIFDLPEFPAGVTTPPSSEWKVISNDDVVYFSGLKRSDGKVMFHPIGSLQFTPD